ncbi:MAG: hypothetical protein ACLVK8_02085 [Ruminococcus sp.]
MVRTDANRSDPEIDGGIEGSEHSCAAASQTCSKRSDRRNSRSHRIGQRQICFVSGAGTDAYEWSFVVVPRSVRQASPSSSPETDGAQRCKQLEQQLQNRDVLLNRMQNVPADAQVAAVSGRGLHGKDAVSAAVSA